MNRFSIPKASSQDPPRGGKGASSASAAAGMRAQHTQVISKPGPQAVQPLIVASAPGRAPQGTDLSLCPVPKDELSLANCLSLPHLISFLASSVNRISFFLRHCA